MRVILRPAALLMEPFSSARLLFFPLPGTAEIDQRGLRALQPGSALAARPQGLACSPRYDRNRLCNCVPIGKATVALAFSSPSWQRLLPCSRPRVEPLSPMPRLSESEVCFSWDSLWGGTETASQQEALRRTPLLIQSSLMSPKHDK
jgi:hypothetical protein